MRPDQASLAGDSAVTLYVHIPFCCRRCAYCGTFRVAEREPDFDPFLRAVAREFALRREESPAALARAPAAVYVGGGMPSLFDPKRLGALLAILREGAPWSAEAEVTLEVHPGSLDRDTAPALREAGFNRLHVRVQSFRNAELETLDRGYTAERAREAVLSAREAGFRAISLDLRYGIPGQTLDTWTTTLKEAIALGCEHVVCNQTAGREENLHDRLLRGHFPESALDEHLLAEYQAAARRLGEAGYEHYEVQSFARAGWASLYARAAWQRGTCHGFGPGAHSFEDGVRWRNAADLGAYLARLLEAGRQPPRERYRLSAENAAQEEIFLGLRQAAGLRWAAVARHLGTAPLAGLERKARLLSAQGFLEPIEGGVRLLPQAWFVAGSVVREMIRALEDRAA